eukprot:4404171-Ditylum_brightwellii.AAC.1
MRGGETELPTQEGHKFKAITKDPGLGMVLKPVNYKPKGPTGSTELEKCLHVLEAELLQMVQGEVALLTDLDGKLSNFSRSYKISEDTIVALTDRTNGHHLTAVSDYVNWVKGHVSKVAIPIKRQNIVSLHKDTLLFDKEMTSLLNADTFGYLMENLN